MARTASPSAAHFRAGHHQRSGYPDGALREFREILQAELARISRVLDKLQLRRRLAPDLTSDDLWLLFEEERMRLLAQLEKVEASIAGDIQDVLDPVGYRKYLELRRRALMATTPPDLHPDIACHPAAGSTSGRNA